MGISQEAILAIRLKPSYLQFLYRLYAPIYDRCLGRLFRDGHRKGIGCLAEGAKLRVLDVGIGTGLSLDHYRPEHDVTGIDLSPAMLSIASKKCVHSPAADVSLMEMDAGELTFPAAHFDAVLLFYSLSVVPNPAAVMAEAVRVLKPDGDLIVVSHSASSHGMLWAIEKVVSPLAKLMGFRSDLRVEDCLNEDSGLGIVGVQRANTLGYWRVFHCRKHAIEEA